MPILRINRFLPHSFGRILRALLWMVIAGPTFGQETPLVRIPKLEEREAPEIDGKLDEAVWLQAADLGDLWQVEPIENGEPSEQTQILMFYRNDALYLGIHCFDREPELIRGTQMTRDARLNPDDRVELLFDPFLDRRNAFWFQISAAGSKGDAIITRNGANFNKEWDGIWSGRARIHERGWSAEMKFPVATLSFDPEQSRWGFNLRRHIRRRTEEVRWATPLQRIDFFSVANAGTVSGIEGLEQGIGLDVVPFVVGDYVRDRVNQRRYTRGDVGFDAFYSITPNLKLSLSANTDFAEVEVDERRVNLTRFNLFFPEKRDFFLEDAGNFFFGPSGGFRGFTDVVPFFSRRIGLVDGEEVPILGAAKVTGRAGGFNIGIMDVQTQERSGLKDKNLFVARVSRNIFEQSDAGVLFTHGNPSADVRNEVYGFDFNYRTDKFLGDRNLRFSTFFLWADSGGITNDELSYHASVSYPNDEVFLSAEATVVDKNFSPALGFVQREAVKKYRFSMNYNPRLNTFVRQIEMGFRPRVFTDPGNEVETSTLVFQPMDIKFDSDDEIETRIFVNHENLEEDFEIQDGIFIPEDSYDFVRHRLEFESSTHRPVGGSASYEFGEFFDGRRTDISGSVDLRMSKYALLGVEYERNDVRLAADDFIVRVFRTRANFQFSPDLTWSNFVQYDNISDGLGLNSRLWWIVQPGHDVFFVLNQGWTYQVGTFKPASTQLSAKIGYTIRF